MLTDLLTWLQAVTGGHVTPYGFYLPLDNYVFIFWKDGVIGFFILAALYYRTRFRRERNKKAPADDGFLRIKGTTIVVNKEKTEMGGKLKTPGPVQSLPGNSAGLERIPFPCRHDLPATGKNFYKNMELILTAAVRTGREVTIEYINGEGARSERRILPREMYSGHGKTYLAAWCCLREEERTFRVDRILSVQDGEGDMGRAAGYQ